MSRALAAASDCVSRKNKKPINNSRREGRARSGRGGSRPDRSSTNSRVNPRDCDRSRFSRSALTQSSNSRERAGIGNGAREREGEGEEVGHRENNELFLTSPLREFRALGKSREHIAFILALFTWRKVISRESTIFHERRARGKWNFNDCRQSQSSAECNYC